VPTPLKLLVAVAVFIATLVALQRLHRRSWVFALSRPRDAYRVRSLLDHEVRAYPEYFVGDIGGAVASLERAVLIAKPIEPYFWNLSVFVLTAAGRYRDALGQRPRTRRRHDVRHRASSTYAFIVINQAEALFNLGKWRRAERLLRALADAGLCADARQHKTSSGVQVRGTSSSSGRGPRQRWGTVTRPGRSTSAGRHIAFKARGPTAFCDGEIFSWASALKQTHGSAGSSRCNGPPRVKPQGSQVRD
jgi:hypothetical protein